MVLVLAMFNNLFYCRVIVHGIGTCNVQQYVLLSYCTWYWYLQCSTTRFTVELLYMVVVLAMFNNMFY